MYLLIKVLRCCHLQDIKELFSIIHKGDSHEQRLLMQIEGARFGAQQLYVEAGLMSCQQHYYHSKEKKNDDSQVLEVSIRF